MINLCHYLSDTFEDECMCITDDDIYLYFSSETIFIETVSVMSDIGLNISQLRFYLQILRYKLGTKLFEP